VKEAAWGLLGFVTLVCVGVYFYCVSVLVSGIAGGESYVKLV
jgi:hypothetical protein